MQITKIRDNVDLIEDGNKKIYLVGSAHISNPSADLAEEIIREVKPEGVAVELCQSRYNSLKDPERWKNTDIISVIREGRIYVLMTQIILAGLQKKLGKQLNIKPGAEMLRAIYVANELNCQVILADREVKTTLKRVWSSIGFWGTIKIIYALLSGLVSTPKISEAEIEKLKSENSLSELLQELHRKMPKLRKSLIDERDQYLAYKIRSFPGSSVVAIIGAGHIPGIKMWLDKKIDIDELTRLPPKSRATKIVTWSIPLLIIGAFALAYFGSGPQRSFQMIKAWFVITGFAGSIGSALALAHPLTVAATFITTPISTVIPVIPAGWISGLMEAWIRKPRVSDFESITDDLGSVKGIWTNRVSKIVLVIILTNTFSRIGMLWGASILANLATLGAN